MSKPAKGDWIVYHSSKEVFGEDKSLQKFTALGQLLMMSLTYKRNADYKKLKDADIRPIIPLLSFIKNKKRWGFSLISGFLEISEADFDIIKNELL